MYSLLIIDDQNDSENRKTIYEFIFNEAFDIKCIDSEENSIITELNNNLFDCVVLDNNLDKGLEKNEVLSLLKDYNLPVIMVSNVREFTLKECTQNQVIDFISLNQYFALRELNESIDDKQIMEKDLIIKCLRDLHDRINYDIFMTNGYINEIKNKLVIGHISDIQFCDPHVEDNSLRTVFNKLEEFIIYMDTPVDILAISGDVVFSGKKEEFDIAYNVIKKFTDKLKRQRKAVEILFVPGNHDFDYQSYWLREKEMCTLDIQEVDKLKKKIVEKENLFDHKLTPNIFKDFEATPIYLNNFKEFAYKLTENDDYNKSVFHIINEKYSKMGYAFVGINNAYKYHKNSDKSKRYMYELDSDVVNEIRKPLYTITVGHIDPRSLGYQRACSSQEDRCSDTLFRNECSEKGQCEKWGDMERLFSKMHSIIYLSGHKHCSDIEISKDKRVLFVGAGSPTGANPSEKTINIIELEKKEGKINARISLNRANPEKIAFLNSQDFEYEIGKGEWLKKTNNN